MKKRLPGRGKPSEASQPAGMLIYTKDGHAAVQLMYPQTSLSNMMVRIVFKMRSEMLRNS